MFLHLLAPLQQLLFLEAARAVIAQDGCRAEVEVDLLRALTAECGSPAESQLVSRPTQELITALQEAFNTEITRRVLVLELAGVAAFDGETHVAELALIEALAQSLSLSSSDVAAMVQFGLEARALVERGQFLLVSSAGVS